MVACGSASTNSKGELRLLDYMKETVLGRLCLLGGRRNKGKERAVALGLLRMEGRQGDDGGGGLGERSRGWGFYSREARVRKGLRLMDGR
ncbi:unnamed protein product [Urochloa humidicola]